MEKKIAFPIILLKFFLYYFSIYNEVLTQLGITLKRPFDLKIKWPLLHPIILNISLTEPVLR